MCRQRTENPVPSWPFPEIRLGGMLICIVLHREGSLVLDKGELNMEQPNSNLLERITMDPNICHGKPCIRGLRYPVEMILELLSGGMSSQDILDDYDDLESEDILAALAFAARLSQIKRVQSVLR